MAHYLWNVKSFFGGMSVIDKTVGVVTSNLHC